MLRKIDPIHIILYRYCAVLISFVFMGTNIFAQKVDVVQQYCKNFASWASEKNITYLHAMEDLRSESPAFRIGNKFMDQLASKNNLPKTDTYDWDVYVPCLQKEVDNGIQISVSNIKSVPEEYVDQKYPGLQYVACNICINGNVSIKSHDLFILKDNKIVKIADYVETTDSTTGKKKIEIDYLDLARCAFADKDYLKCYKLYKEGGLKTIEKIAKEHDGKRSGKDIFPYVESCIALEKWDEAMHGITDNHVITNRKRWINGIEWKLNPEDLKNWSKKKEPLMEFLLKTTYAFYCSNTRSLKDSPIINHISRCRNLPIDKINENAALYFWNERCYWINEVPLRAAAELGHFEAQKQLGKYYLTGHNNDPISQNKSSIPCDTLKAVHWFEKAASKGDIESANIAAHFYMTGHGIKQDFTKAFSLFNMNASKNDYDSNYGLGLCYYMGYGVQRNIQLALPYLKEAEDWHSEVPYIIGNIYYIDDYNPAAITYYNKALKRSNLNKSIRYTILRTLSDCNRYGRCGLPINIKEADKLLEEANTLNAPVLQSINEYLISLTQINVDYEDY